MFEYAIAIGVGFIWGYLVGISSGRRQVFSSVLELWKEKSGK